MKKLLLLLALLCAPGLAQAQCLGQSGINSVPVIGNSCLLQSNAPSYTAVSFGLAAATSATDVSCITGSATQIVRLQTLRISATGTLGVLPVVVTKHASANTGGTAATGVALPVPSRMDSLNPAPTATTTAYTANPTITDGSPLLLEAGVVTISPTTTTSVGTSPLLFDWGQQLQSQDPTIRGTAQQVCVNFQGALPASTVVTIAWFWTETAF